MSECNCTQQVNIYNGVCGGCLLPLHGIIHNEGGSIIKMTAAKIHDVNDGDELIAEELANMLAPLTRNPDTIEACQFVRQSIRQAFKVGLVYSKSKYGTREQGIAECLALLEGANKTPMALRNPGQWAEYIRSKIAKTEG